MKVLRTWVQTPLCLRERNATDFIPIGIHPRELNINWLSKMNVNLVSTELTLLQRNVELESENKKLKKELLDQKLLLPKYKAASEAKHEESRIREENLIKSNKEFKEEMREQSELTNKLLQELLQRHANP